MSEWRLKTKEEIDAEEWEHHDDGRYSLPRNETHTNRGIFYLNEYKYFGERITCFERAGSGSKISDPEDGFQTAYLQNGETISVSMPMLTKEPLPNKYGGMPNYAMFPYWFEALTPYGELFKNNKYKLKRRKTMFGAPKVKEEEFQKQLDELKEKHEKEVRELEEKSLKIAERTAYEVEKQRDRVDFENLKKVESLKFENEKAQEKLRAEFQEKLFAAEAKWKGEIGELKVKQADELAKAKTEAETNALKKLQEGTITMATEGSKEAKKQHELTMEMLKKAPVPTSRTEHQLEYKETKNAPVVEQ